MNTKRTHIHHHARHRSEDEVIRQPQTPPWRHRRTNSEEVSFGSMGQQPSLRPPPRRDVSPPTQRSSSPPEEREEEGCQLYLQKPKITSPTRKIDTNQIPPSFLLQQERNTIAPQQESKVLTITTIKAELDPAADPASSTTKTIVSAPQVKKNNLPQSLILQQTTTVPLQEPRVSSTNTTPAEESLHLPSSKKRSPSLTKRQYDKGRNFRQIRCEIENRKQQQQQAVTSVDIKLQQESSFRRRIGNNNNGSEFMDQAKSTIRPVDRIGHRLREQRRLQKEAEQGNTTTSATATPETG